MHHSFTEKLARIFPRGLRGLIFDCDGVIVDSRAANIGYYNLIMRELGHPPLTQEQEDYAQMSTANQAVENVLTPEELEKVPAICQRFPYGQVTLPMLQAEPGLAEMVEALRSRGIRLGVHTNRNQRGLRDLLTNIGLLHAFDPLMTADVVEPKPSPEGVLRILESWRFEPDTVGFIGDSSTDLHAARGGGVALIAYRSPELEADLHVTSYATLQAALCTDTP